MKTKHAKAVDSQPYDEDEVGINMETISVESHRSIAFVERYHES